MPTNEQRRANAKRKLERQLERRAKQARTRRILLIAAGSIVAVAVIAAVVVTVLNNRHEHKASTAAPSTSTAAPETTTPGQPSQVPPLPPFKPSADVGANCQYPPSPEPAAKQVKPPRTGKVPTDPAQVSASMVTNQGHIGLMLANNESPCTVNSFASLIGQKYFDNTKCHRLTTSPSLGVLQCGDPKGEGTGGPGYQFANEYPTDQYPPNDPKAQQPVLYPRGTLAMANAGPAPTAANSSWCTRTPNCRRSTPFSARSRTTGWPRWTRSPKPVSPGAARTGPPPPRSPSPRCCSTDSRRRRLMVMG